MNDIVNLKTKFISNRRNTQEMQNDKESVISDSYGESYDQSPDAHDYYGRCEAIEGIKSELNQNKFKFKCY